jgi:uracil-DNA glycosylase family 4
MTGFFTKQETESTSRPGGKTLSCASCKLYKDSQNSRMKPYGNFKKDILIIGEFPSSTDDRTGKPFQDGNGKFLQNRLKEVGIDLFEDCLSIIPLLK